MRLRLYFALPLPLDETTNSGERFAAQPLPAGLKSCYGFGKTDKCPYFYSFRIWRFGEPPATAKEKCKEYMARSGARKSIKPTLCHGMATG